MEDKVRRFLNPAEEFCPDCIHELRNIMVCGRCRKNLYGYGGQVYECPLCEDMYCQECWEEMEGGKRFTGTITTWFSRRRYGFLRSRRFDDDIFLHADDLDFEPCEGKKVSFQVEETSKGLRARRIREQ